MYPEGYDPNNPEGPSTAKIIRRQGRDLQDYLQSSEYQLYLLRQKTLEIMYKRGESVPEALPSTCKICHQ